MLSREPHETDPLFIEIGAALSRAQKTFDIPLRQVLILLSIINDQHNRYLSGLGIDTQYKGRPMNKEEILEQVDEMDKILTMSQVARIFDPNLRLP